MTTDNPTSNLRYAVARAISIVAGYPHSEAWLQAADAAIAAARPFIAAETREACLAAVEGERLEDPQAGTSDDGYELALTDASAAIREQVK